MEIKSDGRVLELLTRLLMACSGVVDVTPIRGERGEIVSWRVTPKEGERDEQVCES